ncbi:protein FAM240C [Hypomesus transpacificus]|uniref:protein FAM240C n=1 Tax=Hypomesus transpacificus TaxID=137520 RepID=UPI001F07697F|nr:protein FAM240C [Hypomesus transpacificus]
MNVAKIHDKFLIKNFWEQKIVNQGQHLENEDMRKEKSALSKLREEWVQRLDNRTKHLKNLNEDFLRKAKLAKMSEQT